MRGGGYYYGTTGIDAGAEEWMGCSSIQVHRGKVVLQQLVHEAIAAADALE